MDNTRLALKAFVDHISRASQYPVVNCGIDASNTFVFGYTVAPSDHQRLQRALQQHPVLSGLAGRVIVTRGDVAPYYSSGYPVYPAQQTDNARVNSHQSYPLVRNATIRPAAPPPAADALSSGNVKALSKNVMIALSTSGMFSLAAQKDKEKPYGLVSSVDSRMQLNAGVAKGVADKFGDHYRRISRQNWIFPGECFTYDCPRSNGASGLNNCKSVHNVHLLFAYEQNFQLTLQNAFNNLFEQSERKGLSRIFSPLIGCGNVGGSGEALASAVFAAGREFENSTGRKAAELILVGLSSSETDKNALSGFAKKWEQLSQSVLPPAAAQAKTAPVVAQTTAATNPGLNTPRVLIPGKLAIVMNPCGGMFGFARELSAKGQQFALVNAANERMNHGGGIAKQFSSDLGPLFDRDTQAVPTNTGQCLTVGPYAYGYDQQLGLTGCQNIHNVVAPRAGMHDYDALFTEAVVNLLINASRHDNDHVVCCFIGCAIFGGKGYDLARAVHSAYLDRRIQSLPTVPELTLVGFNKSNQTVYDDFIQSFNQLNQWKPVKLLSGSFSSVNISGAPLQPGGGMSRQLSGSEIGRYDAHDRAGLAAPKEKRPSATSISTPDKRTVAAKGTAIDCGICLESKPEKGSQQVKGLQVCADCVVDYQDGGINLSEVAKRGEEYTAIQYSPLQIKTDGRDLPGYPGAGRIVVSIEATAPYRLSDGRRLQVTTKAHHHYLPNNETGRELLRLLQILHAEKLIYKIDQSHTLGQLGITFNFHLKTSDSGGARYHGYPDQGYPERALSEMMGLAETHGLKDKLDTSRLMALIQQGQKG